MRNPFATRKSRVWLLAGVSIVVLGPLTWGVFTLNRAGAADANPSPEPSASRDGPTAAFCEDLSVLAISATMYAANAAGGAVDRGNDELNRFADNVATKGASLEPKAPNEIREDISLVADSTAKAHEHVGDGDLSEAYDVLYQDETVKAREAIDEYQSPEGGCG